MSDSVPRKSASTVDEPPQRVSGRMLMFMEALYAFHGLDISAASAGLASIPASGPIPMWFTWRDYLALIERFGAAVGKAGIAAAMRGVARVAYAEFRAAKGFFPDPLDFFAFYTHQVMPSMTPPCQGRVERGAGGRARTKIRYDISGEPVSDLFHHGSATLVALFPTHFDLPEAEIEIVSQGPFHLELAAKFPTVRADDPWGYSVTPFPERRTDERVLTPREREVLALVTRGLTNREIAHALGSAPSTVKNQLSSIMAKMQAANRTELASRAHGADGRSQRPT